MRPPLFVAFVLLAACSPAPLPKEAPPVPGATGRCIDCEDRGTTPPQAAAPPACTDDAQCSTGRCLPSGSCAPLSSLRLVDNGPACGDGTRSDGRLVPYCELADAIPAGGQVVIELAASKRPYRSVAIETPGGSARLDLAIVGVGETAPTIGIGDGDAVSIVAEGAPAIITLRNLVIAPTQQAHGGGISCQGTQLGGTLRLGDVVVEGAQGVGLSDSGCTLDVERSTVRGNLGGGVFVFSTAYSLRSTEVSGNMSTGVDLLDSWGTLSHVTVAGNLSASGAAGVACSGGTSVIVDSIVAQNGELDVTALPESPATNLDPRCTVANVAAGSAGLACAPVFVDAEHGDFHVDTTSAAGAACVVDKGAVDERYRDRDGSAMKGAATDLGAYEAE